MSVNKVVRVAGTRIRLQVTEPGHPDRKIPEKYLTKEWIRITDASEFQEIFGSHVSEAARYMDYWFVAIHVTDPHFRTAQEFKEMKNDLFEKYSEEFKNLAFNEGYTKEKLDDLSVFEIAVILDKHYDIELKIDPIHATYVAVKREILTEEEYNGYFVDQLKEECKFFGLAVGGNKKQLIDRLLTVK